MHKIRGSRSHKMYLFIGPVESSHCPVHTVPENEPCINSESDYLVIFLCLYPAYIYLFKVNNGNTRTACEICSKLPERYH